MFAQAIARLPGPDFCRGLTTSNLGTPDYGLMLQQHRAYVGTLQALGLTVVLLEPLEGYPDAYFVEDAAIVTSEVAVIARPGALTRRGEENALAPVVSRCRPCERIVEPGTLEGGDVLFVERRVFVGLSERTNLEGARQLGCVLAPFGYLVEVVPVAEGPHLKSSISYVGKNTLLLTAEMAEQPAFDRFGRILVEADEVYAANSLLINDHLLMPQGFPNTRQKLECLGLEVVELDTSEARKMDGGLSCMSLRF